MIPACHLPDVQCAMWGAEDRDIGRLDVSLVICCWCRGYREFDERSPSPPKRELQLAEWIADVYRIWQPGIERNGRIEDLVDYAAGMK